MALQMDVHQLGDVVLVKCKGRIVAGDDSESLYQRVKALMRSARDFVLHLGEVSFIDSSGLGTLVRLAGVCRAARGDLKLCNVCPEVARVLEITRLHKVLEAHESEIAALSAYYQGQIAKHGGAPSGIAVLCIDGSENVLAYLRELLRQAGYAPITTSNSMDARILITAMRPKLVILGPNTPAGKNLNDVLAGLPTLGLPSAFSTLEAGQAAEDLLNQVRDKLYD